MMSFCCIKATCSLLHFCTKTEGKIRFCAFTLICLITNTEPNISVFVRSHCSSFVKLILGYYSIFKHLCFRAFILIKSLIECVFENLRFCGYPLSKPPFLWRFYADQYERFHKNGGFVSVFVKKRSSVNRALCSSY